MADAAPASKKAIGPGKRLWMAIDGEKGATCNLIFAHILFWALGLTAVLNYGYKDPETPAELAVQDPVQSGPSGSGVFIISLFLAIVATLLWCTRIVLRLMAPPPQEIEEIIQERTTMARRDSAAVDEAAALERKGSQKGKSLAAAAAAV
mmetsp:Transcript_95597/g.169759  ORF Transcript_95597/g.169759 Transcript_95597/m.169759 type:complete len:150 (-) Transcript_95597:301-750(-)|eukprot:CAMPEP_0197663596 /NCGR_PEP_ID=MMETSP1338-20131121/58069_1 /TAXON_ID=43686 ORGANISM="Pelagodinium beii, Strain RCC1491" /NCGR_SAMPLE_ID=MMETSP1338 /ASSEMBLY_ACC=CAM_ASM_000754 /LENGTH=149 /DNA_ID=CAMNT_0043242053 /DNA_START=129 /DNA_END=578 /DNA_ORIENTATION=+